MTTASTTTASGLETRSVEFRAMETDWYVEASGLWDETLAQASVLVEREEQRCSRFRANSTLSLLNREPALMDGRLALLHRGGWSWAATGKLEREGEWSRWVDRKGGRAILVGVTGEPWCAAFGLLLLTGVFLSY